MSRDGRIGNRALLKRIADALEMEGVRRAPMGLNTDQVQVVVDLGRFLDPPEPDAPPQFGAATVLYNSASGIALGGVAQDDREIIPAQTLETRILTFELEYSIPVDVNPAYGQIRIYYQLPVGQPFRAVDLLDAFYCDAAASNLARFAKGGYTYRPTATPGNWQAISGFDWDGYVPPQVPIRLETTKANTGINFAAGTTLSWKFFALQWPVGTIPPY